MPDQVVLQLKENPKDWPENDSVTIQNPRKTSDSVPCPTKVSYSDEPKEKPKNPPNPGTFRRQRTLQRLSFSKPKSRFLEQNYPPPSQAISEKNYGGPDAGSPNRKTQFPVTEEDEEEVFKEEDLPDKYRKKGKISWRGLVEWISFVIIMTCLICSLTLGDLEHKRVWGLETWKWCLTFLVILSGRLVSGWLISLTVFLIERNFILRNKVFYFVYGLRKSVQNCLWLGLVLLAWTFMFDPKVETSSKNHKLLLKVSRALIAVLVAATIWLLKILLVKVLASSFHVKTFFDRIQESIFHHYILETLSGPPLDEISRSPRGNSAGLSSRKTVGSSEKCTGWQSKRKEERGSNRIDIEKLKKLRQDNVSAWSMKRLVSYVMTSGLSTISRTVDETFEDVNGKSDAEIKNELEAKAAAQNIFENVAKPGEKYIEEEDLLNFFNKAEVDAIMPLFEGAVENAKIRKSAFRNWVVKAYIERKALAHSLNDTKTAVHQLHKLASAVVSVVIIVVSLLVMGVATTKVVLVVTSQLLLVGFMFGNTCKTVFESIIFVFVMHPFDVGDRCVIDGVQMIVEEMNILMTIFLRYDNEKIYYPNAVLLTKPISNFNRSPDMSDAVEFSIDVTTPVDTINVLKKSIQAYIESKPKHWHPKTTIIAKEIENVNKMKMVLFITHTMNHNNYTEKIVRRSDLVFEMKRIFENLGIAYHLLPQEVHVSYVGSATARMPMRC